LIETPRIYFFPDALKLHAKPGIIHHDGATWRHLAPPGATKLPSLDGHKKAWHRYVSGKTYKHSY